MPTLRTRVALRTSRVRLIKSNSFSQELIRIAAPEIPPFFWLAKWRAMIDSPLPDLSEDQPGEVTVNWVTREAMSPGKLGLTDRVINVL
jgi:hypothetical protein